MFDGRSMNPGSADSETSKEAPRDQHELHRFGYANWWAAIEDSDDNLISGIETNCPSATEDIPACDDGLRLLAPEA